MNSPCASPIRLSRQRLPLPPSAIYPEEWLTENANEDNQETLLSAPLAPAPSCLKTWARGDSITFKKFDDYWGDKPVYDTLVFRWATEGAARLLELQSGTVDQITNLSPDDFDTVKDDANLTFLPVANPNILYLAMTNTFEPFDDVDGSPGDCHGHRPPAHC